MRGRPPAGWAGGRRRQFDGPQQIDLRALAQCACHADRSQSILLCDCHADLRCAASWRCTCRLQHSCLLCRKPLHHAIRLRALELRSFLVIGRPRLLRKPLALDEVLFKHSPLSRQRCIGSSKQLHGRDGAGLLCRTQCKRASRPCRKL